MRWVPVAARLPHRCAFIPFVGSHDPHGFFQPDYELPGGDTPYVSVVAAQEMAKMLGWQPQGETTGLHAKLKVAEERVAALEAQLASRDETLAAVAVLKQAGFTSAAKPGRKPERKVA